MENGFKVGDRVITIKVAHVKRANGKIGTIITLLGKCAAVKFDTEIESDGGGKSDIWFVDYENMKLIEENPSIHIYPNKSNANETFAILKQGKKVIKTASTICNPTDKYDFNKGAEIAFNRLLRVKEATQKPMEVREVKRKAEVGEWVRVIKDDRSDGKCYRKGDVGMYIKDGKLRTVGGFITTKGTHASNCGKGTSFLYESEYVVLENYNQLDLTTVTNEQLIAELTNRLGGK